MELRGPVVVVEGVAVGGGVVGGREDEDIGAVGGKGVGIPARYYCCLC